MEFVSDVILCSNERDFRLDDIFLLHNDLFPVFKVIDILYCPGNQRCNRFVFKGLLGRLGCNEVVEHLPIYFYMTLWFDDKRCKAVFDTDKNNIFAQTFESGFEVKKYDFNFVNLRRHSWVVG